MTGAAGDTRPLLTAAQIDRLRRWATTENVVDGQTILRSGERQDELVYVESGVVELQADTPIGDPQVLAEMHAGDFIGEMNLVTGQRMYLSAIVREPGVIYRIDPERFSVLIADDVELSDLILTAMYQRREQLAAALAVSVRIVGRPDTPTLLDLLHYVTQRRIAYTWVDAGGTNGAAECEALSIADADLPTVVLPGAVLRAATPKTLADLLD